MTTNLTIEQLALICVIGAIGVIAALSGHWDVAGYALSGCLGALTLQPKQGAAAP